VTEEWRPVVGFPDYEVSSLGRVRSYKQRAPRILRHGSNRCGYAQVRLCIQGILHTRTVHTLVAEAFHGPRPEGLEVRHLDGTRTNNQASNLTYATRLVNMRDQLIHGTHFNASATHCKHGHEFTEENTYRPASGRQRDCRTCRSSRARARYERLRIAA
jgi:hypothetical protein